MRAKAPRIMSRRRATRLRLKRVMRKRLDRLCVHKRAEDPDEITSEAGLTCEVKPCRLQQRGLNLRKVCLACFIGLWVFCLSPLNLVPFGSMVGFNPYVGERIGEAKNPGPGGSTATKRVRQERLLFQRLKQLLQGLATDDSPAPDRGRSPRRRSRSPGAAPDDEPRSPSPGWQVKGKGKGKRRPRPLERKPSHCQL